MIYLIYFLVLSNSALLHREETGIELLNDSVYVPFVPGYVAGKWCLMHRDEFLHFKGKGYIKVRWETEWWYGWFQSSWPEYYSIGNSTLILAAEGDKYFQALSHETCNNIPEYGYINKYFYLDGEAMFINRERKGGHFNGAYNMGIADFAWKDINGNQAQIIYDTEDGILENRTYKILSRGDLKEGPVMEVRSKDNNTPVFVRNYKNDMAADISSSNQGFRVEFIEKDGVSGINYYKIVNSYSNKAITASGADIKTPIIQSEYNGAKKQQWAIHHTTSMYYSLQNRQSNLFFNHDLVNENSFLDERTDDKLTEEFYLFGILDYVQHNAPDEYIRFDSDNAVLSGDAMLKGARHVSSTFYCRLGPGGNATFDININSIKGLYNIRMNYATNYQNQVINIFINDEFQSSLDIPNNQQFVGRIHDIDCYTDGLHSFEGSIISFNLSLNKGNNKIKIFNPDNYVDIDYIDVSIEPLAAEENTNDNDDIEKETNDGSKGLTGGAIAGIVIGILAAVIIIAGIIFIIIKRKMEEYQSDDNAISRLSI